MTQKLEKLQSRFAAGQIDRRQFMQGALAAGLTVSMASSLATNALAATPKKGGHLRAALAHGSTTDSLDPSTTENDFTIAINLNTNNYLTEVDVDGSLKGELAESWEVSDDARTWRFKLRNGVTHHNGKDVTADDVIASINFHRADDSKSSVKPLLKPIQEMKADGDTVVIVLESGNADFPFLMSDYHIPVKPTADGKMEWKDGIGCGGYKLKSFDPGVKAIFERNPNYWKSDRAHLDSAELLAVHDQAARINAIKTGEVELASRPDLKVVALLKRVRSLDVEETSGTLHYTFPMLMDVPPFDNNDVRMALKLAIKRDEILKKVLKGHGVVGNDHPIGRSNRYHADDLPQRAYDPDKAKHHLKKAGMENLKVDLSAADAAFSGAVDAAVLIQESAKAAGININVVREPNDGYWSNVWRKKTWCACYWGGRPTEDWMFTTTHKKGGDWNDTHFTHEGFQKLLVEARSVLDEAKRREMYVEMQRIVRDEGGTAVPMFANYIWAKSKKVAHPDQMAANWDLDGQKYIERWWLT